MRPGNLLADPVKIPVYGMTGMDEIISKTPDALLSGESTRRVIESCIPAIKDANEISVIDLEFLLTAIKIATYGNNMEFRHTCSKCEEASNFELELGTIVTHYNNLKFDDKIPSKEFTIKLRPLSYREYNDFQQKNFALQRTLVQLSSVEKPDENAQDILATLEKLADIQRETIVAQIESIETMDGFVEERAFIDEFLVNSDQSMYQKIREQIVANRDLWTMPSVPVKCDSCGHEEKIAISMDQANFFEKA